MEIFVETIDIKTNPEILHEIGKLRFDVWLDEGEIDPSAISIDSIHGENCWTDPLDDDGYHFIIRDKISSGDSNSSNNNSKIVAAARMTFHTGDTNDCNKSRDFALFIQKSLSLPGCGCGGGIPLPSVDLGRLVVKKEYRGRGYASALNTCRINAAKKLQAKSIIVTASKSNATLLEKHGFVYTGETVYFSDRPRVLFHAMILIL
jgi:predicted GNAT family N-acyltransferase